MDRGAWQAAVHRVTQSDMTEATYMHTSMREKCTKSDQNEKLNSGYDNELVFFFFFFCIYWMEALGSLPN